MMRLLSIKSILVVLVLFVTACESLITEIPDSKLPKAESKLVVQCFISPQSPRINVVVTESIPVFGGTGDEGGVVNAVVKISDGTHEATIPYDAQSELYSLDKSRFNIVAGQTYHLSVTDGTRTVTASCTVPKDFTVPKTYEIDTLIELRNLPPDTLLTVKMTWNDIAGQANFYRMRASLDLEFTVPEGSTPADLKERRIRNRFNFSWRETIGRDNFQSDANLDGTVFSSPVGETILPKPITYDFGGGNSFIFYPKAKIISITMEVYNTDENYFKYHRSLEANRNSDNPFVEPSLVFSNIQGGLGCFAAYHSGLLVYRP